MTVEKFYRLLLDLSILILGAWVLILASGCSTLTTREADRTWEHLGFPPDGPDAPQKFDAEGNPNFGPLNPASSPSPMLFWPPAGKGAGFAT